MAIDRNPGAIAINEQLMLRVYLEGKVMGEVVPEYLKSVEAYLEGTYGPIYQIRRTDTEAYYSLWQEG